MRRLYGYQMFELVYQQSCFGMFPSMNWKTLIDSSSAKEVYSFYKAKASFVASSLVVWCCCSQPSSSLSCSSDWFSQDGQLYSIGDDCWVVLLDSKLLRCCSCSMGLKSIQLFRFCLVVFHLFLAVYHWCSFDCCQNHHLRQYSILYLNSFNNRETQWRTFDQRLLLWVDRLHPRMIRWWYCNLCFHKYFRIVWKDAACRNYLDDELMQGIPSRWSYLWHQWHWTLLSQQRFCCCLCPTNLNNL